jgi:hypothetical protein
MPDEAIHIRNIAKDKAHVGIQVGKVHGPVDVRQGAGAGKSAEWARLVREIRELKQQLHAARSAGLDEETWDQADVELQAAERLAEDGDVESPRRILRILERVRTLVEQSADLVAKVGIAIGVVRGLG